jgi:hypothetical protein
MMPNAGTVLSTGAVGASVVKVLAARVQRIEYENNLARSPISAGRSSAAEGA